MCADLNPAGSPDDEAQWRQVAQALAEGNIAGAEGGEVFETHISYVLVGRELVYKLKKPVVMPFLDYSTRELRQRMCEREYELNRRLAPALYVGVRGVRPIGAGFALCEASDTHSVEHIVLMRRVSNEETLEYRADNLTVQPRELQKVGGVLARFHADAPPAPMPAGTPERLRAWAAQLTAAVRSAPDDLLNPGRVEAACAFLERWLTINEQLLLERVRDGHIRDGHGDLRMNHVVLGDAVEVLDCVEFDDALRRVDVLADLSFLVMELQYAQREDLTRALIDAWSGAGGPLEQRLLWAYASSRALIRVEVGLARVEQLRRQAGSLELRVAEERTQTLLELAVRLSWRARDAAAIVFAGLSGSGKTSISRALACRWGLDRVSSDEVRKRLVAVAQNDAAPRHAYDDYVSKAVYERLGREAGRSVAAGRSVVVDATFRRSIDAQTFVRAFAAAGALAPPLTLACSATDDVLRGRVRERAERGASDAGLDVLDAQLAEPRALAVGISNATELRTEGTLNGAIDAAEAIVLDLTVGPATGT
jgi:aminoglycoside phosphotransferase family enzyme/predicted kinase